MSAPASGPLAAHVRRIYNEYLEMPGLRLTRAQAQRLWGLDATSCVDALQVLVAARFLRQTETGYYVRMTDGAAPAFRMAKAELPPQASGRRAS